ncbi:HNH endonuclease [Nannocystis radixulma]|uniref:HNH endonuclease signature motif containing protein n=1 Tax=Nannocystis radixulma TaxID=2995305 RepID=A0ABT5BGF3_9BACT|nr:HNH endonuclease signature motif containing protein [Nannocystis radixulma]MDC0672066.1 HNH endonuclease signature motif containing protein [Nannocystis radixulma]
MPLPSDDQIWDRVRSFAERCKGAKLPVFSLRDGVPNFITETTDTKIYRLSEKNRSDGRPSAISRRDVLLLWHHLVSETPRPDVPYFTRALLARALDDLLVVADNDVLLRTGDDARTEPPREHEKLAARAWDFLIKRAGAGQSAFYSELGEAIDRFQRALQPILELIESSCARENTPRLAVLVVDKTTKRPRDGFMIDERQSIDDERARVFAFPWDRVPNPFGYARHGETQQTLAEQLVRGTRQPIDVYRLVLARGQAQVVFRAALFEAYDCACAFCGLAVQECLEGAHIHPWSASTPEDRMNPRNGLLLCANHHRMFDAHRIVVGTDYKITSQTSGTTELRASPLFERLRLPALSRHHPDPRLITLRNERMVRHD